MKLKGKTALITGASRGIGRAIALAFASEGANIIVNYKENMKKALSVAKKIQEVGVKAEIVRADISQFSDLKLLVEKSISAIGKIDILVNNAGIGPRENFEECTEETWNSTIDTNLKSIFFLSQLVAKHMKKLRSGNIINIASQAGLVHNNVPIIYGLSKSGVIYLSKFLANILAPEIRVNCISPGRTSTDMTGYATNPLKKAEREKNIPLGRVNEPEDIAKAALFFATADSVNVTGQVLSIDGGEVI
ncbi:MAG: 3-oxoacyl-ACP reductase FabG [Candidatus Dojkabacteria bacterium]|nr:3-oxoacyl-ACP reductase FabG [Candidatus Dojkabacteria bacterium]